MDAKKHIELLTTPRAESVGTLVLEYVSAIQRSSQLLENALENDKILVVGREAAKIAEYSLMVTHLLADK